KLQKRGDYPSFVESMKENLSGAPVVQHLDFDVDSSNAFGAPVTELATITPKDGHSQEDLDGEASKTKGLTPPIAVGKIKQIPEAYLTALGWDSVEIHADAGKLPQFQKFVGKLLEIATIDMVHGAFKN
ncbi:hypothetical protein BDZ97DRAFT_1759850, partial [Flammula alnicola]